MPKQTYVPKSFTPEREKMIKHANDIIAEYQQIGLTLTLRQLYYQFVSRDLLPNTTRSYKNLGNLVNEARLAGRIDWLAIEDRTRNLEALPHWEGPADIVKACADQFNLDLWKDQPNRVEVWIEKEALTGVIEGVCREFDVPYFACRGYTSQSEQWRAAQRFLKLGATQKPVILHLGDHDPSGIDMTRDNADRLIDTFRTRVAVKRLALNMDQVEQYNPPPNPAKATDARFAGYQAEHGDESWELDALDPRVIQDLIRTNIEAHLDRARFDARIAERDAARDRLRTVAEELENE
jgi:hypothetical protein